MRCRQLVLGAGAELAPGLDSWGAEAPDLVLVFGAVPFFSSLRLGDALRRRFPRAAIAGCSTAGEIAANRVYDGACVLTGLWFERGTAVARATVIDAMDQTRAAGARLAAQFTPQGLAAVLLFGTGVAINGSALIDGFQSLRPGVPISGGLAGDAGHFLETWTLGPDGAANNRIVAIGLYGESLRVRHGCHAGWQPFGPVRKITRCRDNVLYELDGVRALDIYQSYLGAYASELPASGLLFPFEMLGPQREELGIFRTILGIDRDGGSLTLAGEVDAGGYLRLMHADTEKLVEGAARAAGQVAAVPAARGDALALLVSCVGRKLVMGDRIEEEVEAVASLLGGQATLAGFYSYGEISGGAAAGACRLHNQTMTITWIQEC